MLIPDVFLGCLRINNFHKISLVLIVQLDINFRSDVQAATRPFQYVATRTDSILVGTTWALGQPSGLKANIFLLLSLIKTTYILYFPSLYNLSTSIICFLWFLRSHGRLGAVKTLSHLSPP